MKREVIVDILDGELSKEERKNFKKENPGYRLCFRLRFPYFPLYVSYAAIVIFVLNIVSSMIYFFITRIT